MFAASVIACGEWVEVRGFRIGATFKRTAAILFGGALIEIGGGVIGASKHLVRVADAVIVDVEFTASSADPERVQLIAVTVAIVDGLVVATAAINGTRSIADSAGIVVSHTIVLIVADPIAVYVCRAITAADVEGVFCFA